MYDVIVVGARVAGAPTALLLARAGHRVLLVDRDIFPSDTLSTHYIHQPGVASLKRWGVLDRVLATGVPPVREAILDFGPVTLTGWGPAVDGEAWAYCPRRTLLDKILLDAAAAAGAEVREGFSIQDLVWDGGRVAGMRGRSRSGATVTEQSRVVVGADGMRSPVARAVQAPVYHEKPPLTCWYYSYFSGVDLPNMVYQAVRDGAVVAAFPTNDDLTVLVAGLRNAEFHAYRSDIEGTFNRTLALAPALAERAAAARREERWVGTADIPNFFRKPHGPGWALVGDAGYHKDPITGYGITDAFRDAETLAAALDAGLSGRAPLEEALAGYQRARDAFALPLYEFICGLATLDPPPPEMQQIIGALAGNREGADQFMGVIDGTVAVPDFFSEENIGRLMAATGGQS
jgi:2-polyprenyl-6-methoxyphenol hydroxylase-like FAD-dependent oxidoreductase